MDSGGQPLDPALAEWADRDRARAIHPQDHDVIRSTEVARSLVLELFGPTATARDLFSACARLGRLMAEAGASPSLAAGTIDNAVAVLTAAGVHVDASRTSAARASLVEGYVAAVREAGHAAVCASWAYPACTVALDGDAVAIACGHPTGDVEALGDWAARIAGRLVKAKIRRAVLSGSEAAKREVASALELVGIATAEGAASEKPAGPGETKSWFRLPWRK
ncbi:MAG TPA: hypothetical protein VM925_28170 [Labilithrix sp.]|nr:hypothetical protein [Labilithrix sp.]